jgi:hypothetical protein
MLDAASSARHALPADAITASESNPQIHTYGPSGKPNALPRLLKAIAGRNSVLKVDIPDVGEDFASGSILDRYGSKDAPASSATNTILAAPGNIRRRQHTTHPPAQTDATKIAFWKSVCTLKTALTAKRPVRLQEALRKNAHMAASSRTSKRLPTPNGRSESP